MRTALLQLADGRLPAGGTGHSGGVEQAGLTDAASLAAFLAGRLATTGLVAAAVAARACALAARPHPLVIITPSCTDSTQREVVIMAGSGWAEVDAEVSARTPSAAQRSASRQQGRALLRLARTAWPSEVYAELGREPHAAVVLGVAAYAAGLGPADAAGIAAYTAVSGPASAAVRLLALDPVAVAAVVAALAPAVDDVAGRAAAYAHCPAAELPAASAPLLDLLAEHHAAREDRLFDS
jgi:urease accessory protein